MSGESAFRPEYCDLIKVHCEAGGTIASFGGTIGAARRTVYNWRDAHPEFDEACDLALNIALFLTEKDHLALARQGGKTAGLEFRLKNLSGFDTWKHVEGREVSGPGGAPVKVDSMLDIAGLSDEQLAVLASIPAG